jgi:hypothetical protein
MIDATRDVTRATPPAVDYGPEAKRGRNVAF